MGPKKRQPIDPAQEETPLSALELATVTELEARITKRLRMFAIDLAERSPVYERRERWDDEGRQLLLERGSPFVWHPGHGCFAPVEDQDAVRADAIYRRDTITEAEDESSSVTTTRLLRLPRGASDAEVGGDTMNFPPRPLEERIRRARQVAATAESPCLRCPEKAAQDTQQTGAKNDGGSGDLRITVYFRLTDDTPIPRVPSRQLIAAAGESRVALYLRDRRDTLLRARRASRIAAGKEFEAALRACGGTVLARFTHAANIFEAEVPVSALEELASHRAVANVTSKGRVRPDGEPDDAFKCTGLPDRRRNKDYETDTCRSADVGGPEHLQVRSERAGMETSLTAFLDSKISAIAAWPYLSNLYDGGGPTAAGGLAPWATGTYYVEGRASNSDTSHIVVTVIEGGHTLDPFHPAFRSHIGGFRVRCVLMRDGTLVRAPDYDSFVQPDNESSHATSTGGVAFGNITDGQDYRIDGTTAREARSGLARRAYAAYSQELLPLVENLGLESTDPQAIGGIDIVVHSEVLNNECSAVASCPGYDEARGRDEPSEQMVSAFIEDGVLYVKSAGNAHGDGCEGCRTPLYRAGFEVSSPAASPAALSVGALSAGDVGESMPPAGMQTVQTLYGISSGGYTSDGRTFPLLVASHFSCGVANAFHFDATGVDFRGYGVHYATSAAAPTVAGAAALFKHWYLDHAGAEANEPGRLMSNLLNFADGFAREERKSGDRIEAPAPTWGLGRFRMRYFSSSEMAFPWGHGVTALTLTPDTFVQVVQLSRQPFSTRVGRLRITLWWLEVNSVRKAAFSAGIWRTNGTNAGLVAVKTNGSNNVIRFDFDCLDVAMAPAPTGDLVLYVVATDLPRERAFTRAERRVVHVAWLWEGKQADDSLIDCGEGWSCSQSTAFGAEVASPDVVRSRIEHMEMLVSALEADIARIGRA